MRAYVDADILIWHLRGESKALRFLERIQAAPGTELWTGAMQRAEVVFFMRPHEEKNTLLFLSQFRIDPVTQVVVDDASALFRKWNPSHGTDANDALLAAQVIAAGGTLYCLNTKHYPIPHLVAKRAWQK